MGIVKILIILGIIAVAAIVAVLAIGIGVAFKNSSSDAKKNKKDDAVLDTDQSEALKNARERLMELRRQVMGIKDTKIHAKANDICGVIDKILTTLKQKPDRIANVHQFINYYLPTLGEILSKYKHIEESGIDQGDIKEKLYSYLVDIKQAMDKQYEGLFADDMFDMTVDMEAMKMAVKRDGLISDVNLEVQSGEQKINLTL